jgi:hypothetical protein
VLDMLFEPQEMAARAKPTQAAARIQFVAANMLDERV